MARIILVALLLTAAGCQNNSGSLIYRKPDRPDDPMFSIEEQQRRGRELLGTVEDSANVAPKAFMDRPGVMGR